MVWIWGLSMITLMTPIAKAKLPADAMPAVFALSMNRKLRNLYDGPFFRFANGDQRFDYPQFTPTEGDKIVRIYDQKSNFGHPSYDAIQTDPELQPTVKMEDGKPVANFTNGQYLTIDVADAITSSEFTIIIKGFSTHPRPLFGCWGNDTLSIEPGEFGRYKINDKQVVLPEGNRIAQFFSGIDKANGGRVIEVKNVTTEGASPQDRVGLIFTDVALGRMDTRYFSGTFSEITFHDKISKIASSKAWEGSKNV